MFDSPAGPPPIVAVVNQKGGVGKTAMEMMLLSAMVAASRRALAIDIDAQGNTTSGLLGVDLDEIADQLSLNEVLLAKEPGTIADIIRDTPWPGIDLVQASGDLANRDMDSDFDAPFRLAEGLKGVDLSAYELCLIDCPPSLGRLMVNALNAASHVLIVTDATVDGLRAITKMKTTIKLVQSRMNPALKEIGIVINRRRVTAEQNFREDELRAGYGDMVFDTVIPERTDLQTAHGLAQPVSSYSGTGAREISKAAAAVLEEINKRIGGQL